MAENLGKHGNKSNHDHSHKDSDCHEHASHDGHHHGHHSHEISKSPSNRFFLGIALNFAFVLFEGGLGIYANSMALIADAGHNLADVASLFLAWGAFLMTQRRPSTNFTYGLKKTSILSALFNSIILMVAVGAIILESSQRFFQNEVIQTDIMMWVAGIGIVINVSTALLFFRDRQHDINIRGAFLHMMSDAFISFGVVVAAIAIQWTGLRWLDPLTSIIISLVIIWGTWRLLVTSFKMSVDAVPENIDPLVVRRALEAVDGVLEIHDLHIWSLSTTETALSVHVVIAKDLNQNQMINEITKMLNSDFSIGHVTVQSEIQDANFHCALKPDEVV